MTPQTILHRFLHILLHFFLHILLDSFPHISMMFRQDFKKERERVVLSLCLAERDTVSERKLHHNINNRERAIAEKHTNRR